MARRWSAIFSRKIIVLLAFLNPVLEAAPDTTLCPAHVNFTQLSSDFDDGNVRGIKRSIDGDISAESPPTFSISPNHEIQPTDSQRNPLLTAQGQTGSERRSHPVLVSKNQELATSKSGKTEKQEGKDGQNHKEHRTENGDTHTKKYLKTDEPAKAETGQHDEGQQKSKNKSKKGDKMNHSTGHHRFGKKKQADKGRNTGKYRLFEGHHKKGHRTKGEHKIHKKNEYHKKHEFYHEHHDGGGQVRNRGFNKTRKKSSGRKRDDGGENAMHKKAHKSIRGGHSKANKHKHITGHVVKKQGTERNAWT